MNTRFENAKMKLCAVADKVTSSKVYKGAEKVAVTVGAGLMTAGAMAVSAFAENAVDGAAGSTGTTIALAAIKASDILQNATPFINAGIPILAVVGGIRLGVRFLRGSMH